MRRVLYPGAFDPFTNGHLDIVNRALEIFDELTLLVAVPPNKNPFLTVEKRIELLKEIFKDRPNVKIDSWSGLTVEYLEEHNIKMIVRGLRPTGDFEPEFQMALMNKKLSKKVDTVFLATDEEYHFISSSLIREVFSHGGNIENFVPSVINKYLKESKGSK